MNGDEKAGERTGAGSEDHEKIMPEVGRRDKAETDAEGIVADPTEAAATGATGAVAGSVVGTTMGHGTEGSLGGAVISGLVGADLADKAAGEGEDEDLPPVDYEKLARYSSGVVEPTIAEQIEEGT